MNISTASASSKSISPIVLIFATVLIDLIGYGVLIPVIPLLLADPQSSFYLLSVNQSLDFGYFLLGLLLSTYPLFQFFSAPILGQLSDKYGRKAILQLSLLGTFLSYIIFAIGIITRNLPLLFFARAFDGLTGGNISVAQAAIADVTPPQHRAKNFGLIGAAFGLGFILGPFIGGKLSDPNVVSFFNAATPFWFAAVLALLNSLSIYFFFSETHLTRNRRLVINWGQSLKNISKAFSLPGIKVLFGVNFLYILGFTFFTSFLSVFLISKLSLSQGQIGDLFSYIGLWIVITQGLIIRRLSLSGRQILNYSIHPNLEPSRA